MIWIGIDAHKRVHQAVALGVDGVLGQKVIANTPAGCTELVRWANAWPERVWAIEGSGSLRRGVAQFLASRGERVHEVNPRWTAQHRRGLRRPGKSGRKHDIPAPTRGPCSCGTPRLSAHLRASAPAERTRAFDKLSMSFFAGTPLDMALRDCGIVGFAIVGLVLEIGIEPTVSHGADLGYVPIVIADACGSVERDARERSLASIGYSLFSHITDADTFCRLLRAAGGAAR